VSAIALALAGYVVGPAPLSRLELSTVDARFSVRGAQPPDRDIVMVPIDAATLTRLMQTSVRAGMARVLDRITAAGPRAIACDIIFTGPSPTQSQGDRALMSAVRRDGARLVLATDSLVEAGTTELFGSSSETFTDLSHPAAGWAGFPGNPLDPHAVVREMERDISASASQAGPESTGPMSMATLAVETVRRADLAPHGALPATAWIDFRGGAGTFPSVPFDDVLSGQPAALSQLRNRIVVLGVTAPAAHDSAHDTSAPGRSVMTGTELQANAISTAQRGFPLRDAGLGVDVALIVGLGLVPFALALRFGAPLSAAGALAAAVLFCIGAQLTFDSGRVINVVFPLVSLVVSSAGVLAVLLMGRRPAHAETPVTASSR
jgi:CHASE2 domain-containing sensor protein